MYVFSSLTPAPSRPPSLQEWADNLKANLLVAFKAAADQRHLEGDYWLAKVLGPAFPAPADMVHAGTEYKEGWLICEAQWYKLEQQSERGYRCAISLHCPCRQTCAVMTLLSVCAACRQRRST